MLTYLSGRYGQRGVWLIVLGAAWIAFGIGVLLEPVEPRSWVLYEQIPTPVQAIGWWLTGGAAIATGLRSTVGKVNDWPGHVALYLMPAVRLCSFTLSWLLWLTSTAMVHTGWLHSAVVIGVSEAWYAALIWLLIAVMLRLVADWPNPERPIPRPPADASERV